jgi:hypothetical protein
MLKATLTKEVTVETPNNVGVAAKLTGLVANQAKANIRAAWAEGVNGQGHFSLITDSNQKVIDALKGEFPKIQEREVLVFDAKNAIGELAEVASKIGNANIDIDYIFTTFLDNKPAIVVYTKDNKKALALFN